jgi:hypothetical protein
MNRMGGTMKPGFGGIHEGWTKGLLSEDNQEMAGNV